MDERLTRAETVVFDVGNVLLRFDAEKVLCLLPEDMRAPFRTARFDPCRLWHEFDRGLESNASIARRAAAAAGEIYEQGLGGVHGDSLFNKLLLEAPRRHGIA